MKKEQILFGVVVVALFVLPLVLSGKKDAPVRRPGRSSRRAQVVQPLDLKGRFIPDETVTWGAANNDKGR